MTYTRRVFDSGKDNLGDSRGRRNVSEEGHSENEELQLVKM